MKKIFIISSLIATTLATPSFATPTELDKKTVASKAYVDTKQDIIETGNVMFWDDPEGTEGDMYVPGLVAYDSQTNALSGNKIGILDQETILGDEGDLWMYSSGGGYGSEMDNFVPTVRAVAEALQHVWNTMSLSLSPLSWNVNGDNGANRTNAINAYNTTFGTGTNRWAGNNTDLIDGQFLANSLALKQNKIPAGTAGNVVTYTGNAGVVGSVAVSSTEDYNQQNELTNGSNLANVQLVSTKQNKMVCAGWDSETHTDEHCWLWSIE